MYIIIVYLVNYNLTGKGTVLLPAEEAGEGVGIPACGVGEGEAREESGEPLALRAEEFELVVEEHEEFLYFHAEEFGETEVAAFVQNDQQAEAAKQLQGFYKYCFHSLVCLLWQRHCASARIMLKGFRDNG